MKNQYYMLTVTAAYPDRALTVVSVDGVTCYKNQNGTLFTDRLDGPAESVLITNSLDIIDGWTSDRKALFVPLYGYPARNTPASEIDVDSQAVAMASKVRYDSIEEYMADPVMIERLTEWLASEDKSVAVLRKLLSTGNKDRDQLLSDWIDFLVEKTGGRVEVISNDVHHVVYTETMFCDLGSQANRAVIDVPLMSTPLFDNPSIIMPAESIEAHMETFALIEDAGIATFSEPGVANMITVRPTSAAERMSIASCFDLISRALLDEDDVVEDFKKRALGE